MQYQKAPLLISETCASAGQTIRSRIGGMQSSKVARGRKGGCWSLSPTQTQVPSKATNQHECIYIWVSALWLEEHKSLNSIQWDRNEF